MSTANFQIVEMPKRTLVGRAADFYGAMSPKFNGQEVLGPVWGLVQAKREEFGLPVGTLMIGATDSANSPEAANGLLTQFVGIVFDELPDDLLGLDVFEVPAGNYATIEHHGGMENLVTSIQEFYTQALPGAGCSQASGLHLEIYDNRFNDGDSSIMTIAAPVK
ncbi:MAG: GyrI-like domain-containing protein [Rhodoluna sp.]